MKRYTTTEGDELAVNFKHVECVSVSTDGRAVIHFASGRSYTLTQAHEFVVNDFERSIR
jgi:uncharacterized protein YlzI (FlbEa/FlbD family)